MFIYEITLAVLLALFLIGGIASGLFYNLLYVYLLARLVAEGVRLYLAYLHGEFLFENWPWTDVHYWLPNIVRSMFFIVILFFITDRFIAFQFPPSTAAWIKTQMVILTLMSIALLWIPTVRVNWPQAIVMGTGCFVIICLILMNKKTHFDNAITLRNPLDQPALILSAGFSPLYNHHFFFKGQRYAADLIAVEYNRNARKQKELSAFTSFGMPLYAPISGEVVATYFDYPDQEIGTTNAEMPVGNYVVIQVAKAQFLLLAHIKHGSGKVAVGDWVTEGDELAALGNSGNTGEPHLHMQVQNHVDFRQVTQTFPIYFKSEGKTVFSRYKVVLP